MTLFEEIVNESSLLTELNSGNDKRIIDAIKNVKRVRMGYNDTKGGMGKNERYILPVAYGLTKGGNRAVRAYQTAGSTKRGLENPRGDKPLANHWKLFRLDRIYQWANGTKSFKEYADTLIDRGLNTNGDKGLNQIFAITPISNGNIELKDPNQPIGPTAIPKSEIEPSTQSQPQPQTSPLTPAAAPKSSAPKPLAPKSSAPKSLARPSDEPKNNNVNVDNQPSKDYLPIEKIDAPETEPVAKTQIEPQSDVQQGQPKPERTEHPSTENPDGPITKDEIEGEPDEKNNLSESFKDMMSRINNLYKD